MLDCNWCKTFHDMCADSTAQQPSRLANSLHSDVACATQNSAWKAKHRSAKFTLDAIPI